MPFELDPKPDWQNEFKRTAYPAVPNGPKKHLPKALRPPRYICRAPVEANLPGNEEGILQTLKERGVAGERLAKERIALRKLVWGKATHDGARPIGSAEKVAAIVNGNPNLKTLADIQPDEVKI